MRKIMYRFYYDENIEEVIKYIRKETKTPNERVNYGDYYCKIKGNYIRMHKYHWLWHKKPQKSFIGTIEPYENGTLISGEFKISTSNKLALAVFSALCLLICVNGISVSNSVWDAFASITMNLLALMVVYAVLGLLFLLSRVVRKKDEQAVLELLGAKAIKQESGELK